MLFRSTSSHLNKDERMRRPLFETLAFAFRHPSCRGVSLLVSQVQT